MHCNVDIAMSYDPRDIPRGDIKRIRYFYFVKVILFLKGSGVERDTQVWIIHAAHFALLANWRDSDLHHGESQR